MDIIRPRDAVDHQRGTLMMDVAKCGEDHNIFGGAIPVLA
jgi:hypothetical protein